MPDSKNKIEKPVVLIGMMGTGKTLIGHLLADALGLSYVDSDQVIEEKAGCTISEIFERDGEAKFRNVEARTIAELMEKGPQVIATGGGTVMNTDTMALIKNCAISVWLESDLPEILKRVSKNKSRPLLQENPENVLKELLQARAPYYAQADIHVHNRENKAQETVREILNALHSL